MKVGVALNMLYEHGKPDVAVVLAGAALTQVRSRKSA